MITAQDVGESEEYMSILFQVILLIVGFVLLMKGADWFVEGAAQGAAKFGIPQIVIGLTIVAMGTSLPEASVSITSAMKGSADITMGNVLGSNIMNVLLILGITALICVIPVQKSTQCYEIPFLLFITVLIVGMGYIGGSINRAEGIVLVLLMVLYLLYLRRQVKMGNAIEEEEESDKPLKGWQMILGILLGIVMISLGSDFVVDSATIIAGAMGVSERIIGLTVIALGTSLPELVTSVTAAFKGKTDIAVGNIVGSNIFNILFVAGITAVITPVSFRASFLTDGIVAIVTVIVLLLCTLHKNRLFRVSGIIMLALYAAYFVYLIQ